MSLSDKDRIGLIFNLKRMVEAALMSEKQDEKLSSAGVAQRDLLDPPSILQS